MNAMQLLLKKCKRKINKVIKGGSILSILFALMISLVIPPFNIYANSQNTIIVPTWDSSTTQNQWDTHLTVENYCEGTNASTNSCKLMFTVDSNYYGYIYFDGYSGNTKWMDFQMVFIADGYGEYNYNLWSNGQISINRINIAIVNLVRPDTTVDLTQIIQLLTAIESDTNAIESYTSQTLTQIRSVLSQLIISNGYLETITKLRQWNIYLESYPFIQNLINRYYPVDMFTNNYFNYPIFNLKTDDYLLIFHGQNTKDYIIIFYADFYLSSSNLSNVFTLNNCTLKSVSILNERIPIGTRTNGFLIKMIVTVTGESPEPNIKCILNDRYYVPIYFGMNDYTDLVSTDFALLFGLSNQLLDDLHIIANGTTQSNSSSSSLETQKGTFDTTSNNLYSSENAFNTDMNSKLQSIDTSFNPSTSFGSKFLSSANWVRTQFDNLTSTSPFGTVLSFSMLLGLSLLIIGKVFK